MHTALESRTVNCSECTYHVLIMQCDESTGCIYGCSNAVRIYILKYMYAWSTGSSSGDSSEDDDDSGYF